MKKKATIYVLSLLSIIFLILIKQNQSLLSHNIYLIFKLWLTIIIPNLFPILIITEYLFQNNLYLIINPKLESYFNKLFKYNQYSLIIIITSIISGSPTNALIIKTMYNNHLISLDNANKLLKNTCYINPLFLIYYLNIIISNVNTRIIILIIYYSINFIFAIFEPIKEYKPSTIHIEKESLVKIITNKFNILINILSTLIINTILITIITKYINNYTIKIIINGIFEITNGLNYLNYSNINNKSLIFMCIIIFNGIAIHLQIKSIIANTSISYKTFLKDRLIKLLICACIIGILAIFPKAFWH